MQELIKSICQFLSGFINNFFTLFIRPLWKLIFHCFTGKCEIERILLDANCSNHARNVRIERSLKHSKQLSGILNHCSYDSYVMVDKIIRAKFNIPDEVEFTSSTSSQLQQRIETFKLQLNTSIKQILSYERLKTLIETARSEFYNKQNGEHEQKLLRLWSLLNPNECLSNRISDQWAKELGFQGCDPATDFRGMGLLGLDQLIYFAEKHNERCRHIMHKSKHPTSGYPFSVVGISITALARDFLQRNELKPYFHKLAKPNGLVGPDIADFHDFYCHLFFAFDEFWYTSKPESIMEFGRIRGEFSVYILQQINNVEGSVAFSSLLRA